MDFESMNQEWDESMPDLRQARKQHPFAAMTPTDMKEVYSLSGLSEEFGIVDLDRLRAASAEIKHMLYRNASVVSDRIDKFLRMCEAHAQGITYK